MHRVHRCFPHLLVAALCVHVVGASWAVAPVLATVQDGAVRLVDLVDNGTFGDALDERAEGLPWWRTRSGAVRVEEGACVLAADAVIEQPVAAFAPLAHRLRIVGEVAGEGRLEIALEDGSVVFARDVSGAFEFEPGDIGRPRYLLRLSALRGEARWQHVAVFVPLPAPTADALRREVLGHLSAIHELWLERSLDVAGPRATAFVTNTFDANTGERGPTMARVGLHPLWAQILKVSRYGGAGGAASRHQSALTRYIDDLIELGLQPETGLPRLWNPVADEPDVERVIEIGDYLEFLLDVAEHGPASRRDRALQAALRIGDTVLEHGLRPDGSVAAAYRPRDARPSTVDSPLRQLDVPAQLARLAPWRGDEACLEATREALWTLEYKHTWPTAWGKIDPGFDDQFGHLGARALVMWRAFPEEKAFRRLVESGLQVYLPALADLVRFGGYVAADQVRCWRIFVDVAGRVPEQSSAVGPTLYAAARQHFKAGQTNGGFWIDVTMTGWGPVSNLPVGDLGGLPQNLLQGLAVLARADSGLTDEQRGDILAMYTAVMRSSLAAYGAELTLAMAPRAGPGFRSAEGSLRFAAGMAEMLRALGPE